MRIVAVSAVFVAIVAVAMLAWPNRASQSSRPVTPNSEQAERAKAINEIANRPTADSTARRMRSIAKLKQEGVPVSLGLPVIQSEAATRIRDREDVAIRAICLLIVALKAEGIDKTDVDSLIAKFGVAQSFSPEERDFLAVLAPDMPSRAKFSWRYEAAGSLLWSIGYVAVHDAPKAPLNPAPLIELLKRHDRKSFIANAVLKTKSDILD